MLVYEYTTDDLAEYEAPEYFPPVTNNHALCTKITNEEIRVPEEKLVKSAYPGALFDVYYPGFPTTKHLKYKVTFNSIRKQNFMLGNQINIVLCIFRAI